MIRKILFLCSFSVLLITSCSKPNKVVITSHSNNLTASDTVSEIVTITCEPFEDSEISKIKCVVDGKIILSEDDSAPWSIKWNTVDYDDQSNHILNILAFGPDGDSTYSDTLQLVVDNSKSYPDKVAISNIELVDKGFNLVWEKSQDIDFSRYILEKGSNKSMSDAKVIFNSNIITDNQFRDEKINPLKFQYYRISVEDYVGYQTKGDVFSSNLEKVPTSINIKKVDYNNTTMKVSWNRSIDSDFSYYSLYKANSLKGKKKRIKKITSQNKTSFSILDFNPLIENWFWIEVTDKHGYKTTGKGKTNSIDNPPTPTQISSIDYNDKELRIIWDINSDSDFQSYEIFMSNKNIDNFSLGKISEQSMNTLSISSFDPTIVNNYLIKTTDRWGQTSVGERVSNKIDKAPNQVSINALYFENKSLVLEWTQSDEDNFDKYYICHTHDLGINPDTVAVYNNQNITNHKLVSGFNANIDNWVWVIVSDSRYQSAISPPQVIKNIPPEKSQVTLTTDENDNLQLQWNKNTDPDFNRYFLYYSQNPNMNDKQIIYESNNSITNSYNFIVEDFSRINYFQLMVEDIFELQVNSDIVSGVPTDLQVLLDIVLENNLNVIPSELGTQVWTNGKLTELSIGKWSDGGGIKIKTLPESIGKLTQLKNLWLSYNKIQKLPESFIDLENLEILELRSNQFLAIPQLLTELESLKYLGLSYNKIDNMPEWVSGFKTLEKLYLSHNQLAEIPENVCGLNLNYKDMGNSFLSQNHLCTKFLLPDCINSHVGDQNCSGD
jgi:hypothetical protein